jgi:Ca2+-binding RTX toxin-like protein
MAFTKPRVKGLVSVIIAAGLGMLLLTAANNASAGGAQGPRCEGKKETVAGNTGTNGNDVMVGTGAQETINGKGGDDLICSRAGNDNVLGGTGNDRVRAGAGNDFVNGEDGNDELFGNGGDDSPQNKGKRGIFHGIVGGEGNDVMGGGSGDDQLTGQGGTDVHNGAEGFDGCFDEDVDSQFNSCEYGSVQPPR